MRFAQPTRLLLLGGALAAVSAIALLAGALNSTPTEADIVAGEYSMEVDAPAAQVGTTPFTFDVLIEHAGTADCDATPDAYGCYQAAQWHINYDETILSIEATGAVATNPSECPSRNDNNQRLLLGCISFATPLSFSGVAWTVTAVCIADGTSPLTLETGGLGPTQVLDVTASAEPMHLHSDSIDCSGVGTAPATATPTETQTAAPTNTPAATNTPTATATPCPGGVCPTATPTVTLTASATFVAQDTRTATAVPSGTPDPNATVPPGGTPPPPPDDGGAGPGAGSPTRTGTGGTGAGGLRPPDTGSGSAAGGMGALSWLWIAVGGTGVALAVAGSAAQWRRDR